LRVSKDARKECCKYYFSYIILLASTVLLALLSIKIYSSGVMNYGNRITFNKAFRMILKSR